MTDRGNGRLSGKVVLVTGAAQGIGAACTRRMASEGARLWLNDVSESLHGLVAELEADGVDVHAELGDASDPAVISAWVDAAAVAWGGIDVLYNNVGISRAGLIGELSDTDWHDQQRLTLDTVFYATRAVLPHLLARGGGSIVSMASGAGIGGNYRLGGYAAAKAGVINLMETVATEYGPQGVRANSVTPGPTATAPLVAYYEGRPDDIDTLVSGLDLRRLTDPGEVAEVVLWLASDESSSITGTCLRSNIRAANNRPV